MLELGIQRVGAVKPLDAAKPRRGPRALAKRRGHGGFADPVNPHEELITPPEEEVLPERHHLHFTADRAGRHRRHVVNKRIRPVRIACRGGVREATLSTSQKKR
ncbi:unnamed protein product [Phytomonas sp. EM1]|nr:unnamed protein product [Phytomonas sp. EM1]|eukprot:CCW59790.1 unnamed protein product [Phytomonas sp. isolate EM1]